MNVEKTEVMRIKATIPNTEYDRSKTVGECGIFSYLGTITTNDVRCTQKIKSWIVMAKAACNKKKFVFTHKLNLHLRKKPVRCHILYSAENWTLWRVDQKYLKSLTVCHPHCVRSIIQSSSVYISIYAYSHEHNNITVSSDI